jgi:leucyl-tRNA synthetase
MAKSYDHKNIEQKWQEIWEKEGIYKTPDNVSGKENFYTLVEFAYPSGNLHVGHWYAFSVPDIYARYQRMNGKNVLYPIGFDSFGLPAENAAIKRGLDPKEWTYSNMDNMRAQLRSMGAMFDWDRAVATSDPEYYKWTQSMFTKFFEKDLVYRATTKVNWCPKDQTILANEQVVNGKCERCDTEVIQKDQDQWSFRITKYADRLHDDLETLDWPESIKDSQRAWIGRSEGAEIDFKIKDSEEKIKIFTTRPDTLFGVTYVVLSPEHSLLEILLLENKDEVSAYAKQAKNKSDLERQQTKEKTGVELKGVKAINPANGEEIPVWVSDYVLSGYGTGAVMAVPAHDERDFEFAKKFGLPLRQAIIRETGIKRENEEFRDGGAAVVFDPISQKYAVALHDDGKPLLFAGGVGENELVKDAVVREVLEESGLYDFKNVELLEVSYAHYFNTAKKVNRVARAEAYLITLDSTAR